MPQFLIDPTKIKDNKTSLTGNEAKHLVKVLRHKRGDHIWVSDGTHQHHAIIESVGSKEVELILLNSRLLSKKAPSPILGIALLKHDHLEMVLQKSVELGIREFFLFISKRTIPHYHESATPKKLARFEKIALEAAKQSGMITIPKIHPVVTWDLLMKRLPEFSAVILAWEEEEEGSFNAVFQNLDTSRLVVLIGPEGGLTKEEVEQAKKAGAKIVSLGRQILRSETAAIATLTLCQYELGNI